MSTVASGASTQRTCGPVHAMAMPTVATVAAALLASTVWGAAVQSAPGAVNGDAAGGQAIYERCAACHALGHDRAGPRHCGLFGRRAGSVQGFDYSPAMKRSGIVWNARTLDRFLADPPGVVPGTSMGYAGIADAKERADLLAYLERAGRSAACR